MSRELIRCSMCGRYSHLPEAAENEPPSLAKVCANCRTVDLVRRANFKPSKTLEQLAKRPKRKRKPITTPPQKQKYSEKSENKVNIQEMSDSQITDTFAATLQRPNRQNAAFNKRQIYLIINKELGLAKVGISNRPDLRLDQLCQTTPFPLNMVWSVPLNNRVNTEIIENIIHNELKKYRVFFTVSDNKTSFSREVLAAHERILKSKHLIGNYLDRSGCTIRFGGYTEWFAIEAINGKHSNFLNGVIKSNDLLTEY
ncbi:GIY-YIG nuclease family protein [Vibrio sp. SCSIO 43140]|uniref:GIY-YIG nuclease family protein n=1 Tax=Vibrio sp. SCSIO 43140 TaxID=2819100 RepID=UPI0020763ACB|nr:GIY-YIG nuclease family protein [Vibrio sp. SCSIO 43140]USD58804.1 GIY-YIG nuclease family protein [Vibrio sp. SCSIO 43140]USD59138.1 GIY-YIG nuclease family protein [Vibrio sp. SCSIO 43140]USD59709.1 GIY-YIG nuclease family protein [Vibrio sp. SCSIO 43140]